SDPRRAQPHTPRPRTPPTGAVGRALAGCSSAHGGDGGTRLLRPRLRRPLGLLAPHPALVPGSRLAVLERRREPAVALAERGRRCGGPDVDAVPGAPREPPQP